MKKKLRSGEPFSRVNKQLREEIARLREVIDRRRASINNALTSQESRMLDVLRRSRHRMIGIALAAAVAGYVLGILSAIAHSGL